MGLHAVLRGRGHAHHLGGDQIVGEIRAPLANAERDSGVATEVSLNEQALYGRVVYTHGMGLDRPLALVRLDYDSLFPAPEMILPHTNWSGTYDSGTFTSTGMGQSNCVKLPDGQPTDNEELSPPPGEEPGAVLPGETRCMEVSWPAPYLWKTHKERQRPTPKSWMGSLILGMRDESGQMYRRNRYYDPNTGRFTQEDPIGIAGGLNVYGFANGDPVSYSDPYGLCPKWLQEQSPVACWGYDAMHAFVYGPEFEDYPSSSGALGDAGWMDGVAAGLTVATAGTGSAARAIVGRGAVRGAAGDNVGLFLRDFATKNTKNWSASMVSQRDARSLARRMLGRNPVEVEPNKWRSTDGRWQYRAKAVDVEDKHIHLEQLNPETGEVIQNVHLRWQ